MFFRCSKEIKQLSEVGSRPDILLECKLPFIHSLTLCFWKSHSGNFAFGNPSPMWRHITGYPTHIYFACFFSFFKYLQNRPSIDIFFNSHNISFLSTPSKPNKPSQYIYLNTWLMQFVFEWTLCFTRHIVWLLASNSLKPSNGNTANSFPLN